MQHLVNMSKKRAPIQEPNGVDVTRVCKDEQRGAKRNERGSKASYAVVSSLYKL
tara:strand:- start:3268 stop:3429 length:162 start_codon:yes stop_codon:yes gene_type:complete